MNNLRISELPEESRPYEKLMELGEDSLTDAELLAILVNSGNFGATALDLAHQLLAKFDGLAGLQAASLTDLQELRGIGKVKSLRIRAAIEFGRRVVLRAPRAGIEITSPELAGAYFQERLGHLDHEEFHCLFLDVRKRIIKSERIASGGIDGAAVRPREVFRKALRTNAHSMIVSHNHPSNEVDPSGADIHLSKALMDLGRKIGIEVLDHIIVGENKYLSMKQKGFI